MCKNVNMTLQCVQLTKEQNESLFKFNIVCTNNMLRCTCMSSNIVSTEDKQKSEKLAVLLFNFRFSNRIKIVAMQ